MELQKIACIRTDFPDKFGLPRQSGLVRELTGRIVFERPFRTPDALRGLGGFSHIWVIWGFSKAQRNRWSATVRPPRLGGNQRMGVFATRSPFRPNPIGLSALELAGIEETEEEGAVLLVRGIDMVDGTPIYDIKPYLPYADAIVGARSGFAQGAPESSLQVEFSQELLCRLPEEKQVGLLQILAADPRPHYQEDVNRRYGFSYAGWEIGFTVDGDVLQVRDVTLEEDAPCRESSS